MKKAVLTILLIVGAICNVCASSSYDYGFLCVDTTLVESSNEPVHNVMEIMPEFPGGMKGFAQYLKENLQYPRSSLERGSQGKVIVSFVVDTDGSITDINVIRGAGDPLLDKEAVRIVQAMPKWKPGSRSGKAVRVRFTTPITFRLE